MPCNFRQGEGEPILDNLAKAEHRHTSTIQCSEAAEPIKSNYSFLRRFKIKGNFNIQREPLLNLITFLCGSHGNAAYEKNLQQGREWLLLVKNSFSNKGREIFTSTFILVKLKNQMRPTLLTVSEQQTLFVEDFSVKLHQALGLGLPSIIAPP